jgi:Fe-S cluster biosynthesis and repair protein YggX
LIFCYVSTRLTRTAQKFLEEMSSMNQISNERKVFCKKYQKELPGLEKPPFKGETGQLIFDNCSKEAWKMWSQDMQIKVLNEYRLNMADPKDYQVLVDQMLIFLNLQKGDNVEVENAERGKE